MNATDIINELTTALAKATDFIRQQEDVIRDLRNPQGLTQNAMAKKIVAEVAQANGVSMNAIYSKGRSRRDVIEARWEAWHRIRFDLDWSKNRIGRHFGRHQSTIDHGLERYAEKLRPLKIAAE